MAKKRGAEGEGRGAGASGADASRTSFPTADPARH